MRSAPTPTRFTSVAPPETIRKITAVSAPSSISWPLAWTCTAQHPAAVTATTPAPSFAAPTAAGVAALVLGVNPDLTWQQVRQTLRDTCDKIGGVVYDGNGHNDDYGWGRVNAARAVCTAGRTVELETPAVTFNDVPEGERSRRGPWSSQ